MTSHSPSFLDLTAHSELRPKVISPDAVVVFASGLDRILWANAAGAALFGGSSIADLIDTRLSDRHPLVRQLQHAARQIDGVDSITRRFKVTRGLKTESVESDLSSISLPDGSSAVLLVSKETGKRGKRREYDLAQDAIEALEGFVDASAILDEFGLTIAASSGFDDADIDPDLLEEIAQAAFEQSEPVLKKVLDDIGDGPTIAGIARLKTRPGRLLVILADDVDEEPGETDGEIETSTAASAAAATAATGASLLATSDEVKAENAVSAPEEGSADYAPETVGSAEETKEDAWRPDRIDETATLFDPLETDQSNAGASSDEAETTEWLSDAELNPGTEETGDIP